MYLRKIGPEKVKQIEIAQGHVQRLWSYWCRAFE